MAAVRLEVYFLSVELLVTVVTLKFCAAFVSLIYHYNTFDIGAVTRDIRSHNRVSGFGFKIY